MNRLLTILLLLGATAHGQIDNPPTSVNIVDSTATGRAVLTATNAAAAATAVGLGATNDVTFSNITASGIITAKDSTGGAATNSTLARGIQWTNLGGGGVAAIYGSYPGVPQIYLAVGATNALTDVATFRATGMTVNSNAIVGGTLAVSNAATFSTNVTVNGNLSVGSLTTTTPSTWALDATQTAAATNGILALPSNANVIRLTNNNAISGVSGGVLGAFYYLVNQTTNAVTISNVGGITVQGGTSLTLGANQAATLVATGATNASVAARGDLTDVALGGTANTAPSQTASSGSSLMTRDLGDVRYLGLKSHSINFAQFAAVTANGGSSGSFRGAWQIFTETNASSFATAYGEWAFLLGLSLNERYVNFSNPFSVSFSRTIQPAGALPRAGLTQYVQLGRDVGAINTTNSKLAQKGVGIQFASNGLTPFVHNGTSLTDGSAITNISAYNRFVLRWVPATAFEVYGVVNGSEPVLLGSVTNNLPSGNSATEPCLEFSQLDSGSGGATAWFWLNNGYIITP